MPERVHTHTVLSILELESQPFSLRDLVHSVVHVDDTFRVVINELERFPPQRIECLVLHGTESEPVGVRILAQHIEKGLCVPSITLNKILVVAEDLDILAC